MSCAFKVSGLENQLVKFFSNLCCDAIIYSCVCVCVCVCVQGALCVKFHLQLFITQNYLSLSRGFHATNSLSAHEVLQNSFTTCLDLFLADVVQSGSGGGPQGKGREGSSWELPPEGGSSHPAQKGPDSLNGLFAMYEAPQPQEVRILLFINTLSHFSFHLLCASRFVFYCYFMFFRPTLQVFRTCLFLWLLVYTTIIFIFGFLSRLCQQH